MITPANTDSITYAGSFVYDNETLSYVLFEEGRLEAFTDAPFAYQYFLKDHLGNTRVTFDANTESIKQQDHYYPFGMNFAGIEQTSGLANLYKYNGKELQNDLIDGKQLNWYDYGWRFYDPVVARWHVIDPMAEEPHNLSFSPYNYCVNNPIRLIDPNGMDWFENEDGRIFFQKGVSELSEEHGKGWTNIGGDNKFGETFKFRNDEFNISDYPGELSIRFDKQSSIDFMGEQGYDLKTIEEVSIETERVYSVTEAEGDVMETARTNTTEEVLSTKKSYINKENTYKSTEKEILQTLNREGGVPIYKETNMVKKNFSYSKTDNSRRDYSGVKKFGMKVLKFAMDLFSGKKKK